MPVTRAQLDSLREPLDAEAIEWRVGQSGIKNGKPWARLLAYLTARAVQSRLDEVCGPENWKQVYRPGPCGGVVCGIAIYCVYNDADGVERARWVTKWDGGENSDIEAVKGGLSDAFKRAAVVWGIGRYIYDLGESWATFADDGAHSAKIDGKFYKWRAPLLPAWALPPQKMAAAEQLAKIEALVARVQDQKIVRSIRKRLGDGMTVDAARECIKYLDGLVSASAPADHSSDGRTSAARAPGVDSPAAGGADTSTPAATEGAKCPKCGGAMQDRRFTKSTPKAPDFVCNDLHCTGRIWPAPQGRDAQGRNLAKVQPVQPAADPVSEAAAHMRGVAERKGASKEKRAVSVGATDGEVPF